MSLNDSRLEELSFRGLLLHIKERFSSQDFVGLSHLAQRLSSVDVHVQDPQNNSFTKKVNLVGDCSDSKNEAEIGLAEWVRNKMLISCSSAKRR